MARTNIGSGGWSPTGNPKKKRTSIGRSKNSRPKNKHKKRCHKKYRGQGK